MRKIQKYNRFFRGQAPLRMTEQNNCHCERSVPQATPTGGPVRDERSEHAISDGLPRAHALAMTEVGRSVFPCHPCAGGDLTGCLRNRFPVKRGMTTEGGRSMVEMLGVLAIMGIVGMVGVKMYSVAMNKHKANELIYEAQKRATMVAMQITAGQENLSVANFTNPTGYTFGVEKNPLNENQFNITITGVDSKVCDHMKTAVGPNTPLRLISDDCTTLTLNNDLSLTKWGSDYKTQTDCINNKKIWHGDQETGICLDSGSECAGGNCVATNCPDWASTDGPRAGGKTGIYVNNTECKCDNSTDVYTGGTACVTKPGSCSDWTKNECGFGYYCKFDYNSNNYLGTWDIAQQTCWQNMTGGTCTSIASLVKTPVDIQIDANGTTKRLYKYSANTTWWTAASLCNTNHNGLVTPADLEIKNSGGCTSNCQMTCACGTNGATCQTNDEGCINKDSQTGLGICDCWEYLRNTDLGNTYFWTSIPYSNSSDNSCSVLDVRTSKTEQGVNRNLRDRSFYRALCR